MLKPGGRLCVIEITRPENRVQAALRKACLRGIVPWLAKFASRGANTPRLWAYDRDTIDACISPGRVIAAPATPA